MMRCHSTIARQHVAAQTEEILAAGTITVSIAAHYVPARVRYLAQALSCIASWDEPSVVVSVVTNDLALAEHPDLATGVLAIEEAGYSLTLNHATNLDSPFHLPWVHKQQLREWSRSDGHREDLFLYIEDDMAISAANIAYIRRYLPAAKTAGFLPALLCYEEAPSGESYVAGFRGPQLVQPNEVIELEGQCFIAPKFPYWPGYVMDRELACEYFRSDWADRESANRQPEGPKDDPRVHAALGLTYVDVPDGLTSRSLLPVDKDWTPLPECMALHLPGNYVRTRKYSFGTVPTERMFLRPSLGASAALKLWNARAVLRRIADKLCRLFGFS